MATKVEQSAFAGKHFQQIKEALDPSNIKHKVFLELFEKFSPIEIIDFLEAYHNYLPFEKGGEDVYDANFILSQIHSSMLSIHLDLVGHPRDREGSVAEIINTLMTVFKVTYTSIDIVKSLDFFGNHLFGHADKLSIEGENILIFQALRNVFFNHHGYTNDWNFKEYVNITMN